MARSRARGSDEGLAIDRRTFIGAALALGLWSRQLWADTHEGADHPELSQAALDALPGSQFVYVSPLKTDGEESTCHGEVWYAWLDGSVALITGTSRWKARSVAAGLDRARIWVGNHGTWKRTLGTNEDFRKAPSFVGRARTSQEPQLLERMLVDYERKYPDEIGRWRDRFREGLASGERVILLYEPVSS
jgi:hypothetical protein